MILQFVINGLITGLLYATVALAFGLTYNTTKVFHIAYASVLVAGGYIMMSLTKMGLSILTALFLTILFCGLLNLLIEKLFYQPMEKRKNSHNTIMIASIGIFIVMTNLIALFYGNENQVLNQEIFQSFTFGNIIITQMQLWQFIVAVVCIFLVMFFVKKTSWGLKIRALSNDGELFAVFGNNSFLLRNLMYFISGIIAGVVSLLLAYDVGFDPYFGLTFLLNAMVAMIIGGFGSYKGSLLGGIMLGVLQSLSVYFFEARWETAITFFIFLIILVFRPRGLFGKKLRKI